MEDQYAEARVVPEKDMEHFTGNKLLFRDFSSSGNNPTIDLFKGNKKNGEMKFIEEGINGSKK